VFGQRYKKYHVLSQFPGESQYGKVSAVMRSAGLAEIHYQRFMFGTIAVQVGIRPQTGKRYKRLSAEVKS